MSELPDFFFKYQPNLQFSLHYREILDHSWIVGGGTTSPKLVTPRWFQRQQSIEEFNNFVKSTMMLNRTISFDEQSTDQKSTKMKLGKAILINWKSVDTENDILKRRHIRFSRTLDLESTMKFSSIDE